MKLRNEKKSKELKYFYPDANYKCGSESTTSDPYHDDHPDHCIRRTRRGDES